MTRSTSTPGRTVFNLTRMLIVCILACFPAKANVGKSAKDIPFASIDTATVVSLTDYGAIGDGVADDSSALQLAIDDLAASGGGTLQVPSGRYRLGTPVSAHFAPGVSLTIQGAPSSTPIVVAGNGKGLNLTSEFIVAVGEANDAITFTGVDDLLFKDVGFVGVLAVFADARRVLALSGIRQATVQHCEFYGLLSRVQEGAIISTHLTDLRIEQTAFLGCAANSAINTPVVRTTSWLGIAVRDCKFIDYGDRPDFFSKTPLQSPYSWILVGNPHDPEPAQSRREVILDNVFLDEGAFLQFAVIPSFFSAKHVAFETYLSRLNVNVNNLFSDGIFVSDASKVFIDKSNFGWSERAGFAIALSNVGDVILDQIQTSADATRLSVSANRLTVINSIYTSLTSPGLTTIINTGALEEDPAHFVRQRYLAVLNRDPDPAGHYYWTDKVLRCEGESDCISQTYDLLEQFLNTSPLANFSAFGQVVDQDGLPLSGVNLRLSGSQSTEMFSDVNGEFSFDRLATAGEYEITPTKNHYLFERRTFVRPSSHIVTNFTGTLLRYNIAGRVVTTSGAPLPGATIVLSGDEEASTTSDAEGRYSFNNLGGGGNYTTTVSRQNYRFDVVSRTFADLSNDLSCDFTGVVLKFTIAGTVKKPDGTALAGASVQLSNETVASQITDLSGNYSFLVNAEANYSVTITHQNYFFEPPSKGFAVLSKNERADFQGVNPVVVSGRITTPKGLRLAGVSISLTGSEIGTSETDINGNYLFRIRPGGNLTVTPTKSNYTFDPVSTTISDAQADQVMDFEAIANRDVPVLVNGTDPSRALALDAVLHVPEPFDLRYDHAWSADQRTRLALYVENVDLRVAASNVDVTVELEEPSGQIYPLVVEQVQLLNALHLLNSVTVRLNDNLRVSGDYKLRIRYRGIASEALLIAIADTQP
ncbi:MAG TPA: carboxypeptidase regulatory-like domain-containing protein [Pyrinomonadaceae bacterium]